MASVRALFGALVAGAVASCGGPDPLLDFVFRADSSVDAPAVPRPRAMSCTSSSQCSNGLTCVFFVSGGCDAIGKCQTYDDCTGPEVCGCDGISTLACGENVDKPVVSVGPCTPDGG